jgi:hypothetical protein
MPLKYYIRIIFSCLFFFFGVINNCNAQSSSLEFWPETDIWYRLNQSWRFSSFIPVTKNVETKYREIAISLLADYAWGKTKHVIMRRMMDDNKKQKLKAWMVRGGFMEGWSISDHGENYSEDQIFSEIHRRIPLKGNVLFSQRLRNDLRWIGKDPNFSYRFRYRIMFEKEYQARRSSIVPYLSAEPFWDSRYSYVNRLRLIGGASFDWKRRVALETNFTYQYDSKSSVTNVYATNIILHLFFEKKQKNNGG